MEKKEREREQRKKGRISIVEGTRRFVVGEFNDLKIYIWVKFIIWWWSGWGAGGDKKNV